MEVSILGCPLPYSIIPTNSCFIYAKASPTTTFVKGPNKEKPNNAQLKLKHNKLQVPSKSYSPRKSAILEIQLSSDLDSALTRYGDVLKVQDLNAILRHFGIRKRWSKLSQCFDWMQQNKKICPSSYSNYIKFTGGNHNPVGALDVYNSIQDESTKKNIVICNSVLGSLVRNGKFDHSIKFFCQMKQDGLTPDVVTYSTLLSGCIKAKQGYSIAMELVQELQQNGVQMDNVIYGTLLAICASHNKLSEAERYFNQMKEEGHSPNVFHYSSLLNAYSMCGDYKKADILIQDMESTGLPPNKVILTTLLKVYVRGGLFEKSRELLAELQAKGFAKDEMPYCLLMNALAKTGQINEAKSVFDEMLEKCVSSDGYSYSIMISAFCRGGLLEEAKQLAKDFEARYDTYDLVMLNTMLCAYCRSGEMESVMEMLKKMDELAISPDYTTFHILIKYFCKEKLYLLAYRMTVDMHNKGHQLDEELCSTLIFHLGKMKAHADAFSVYNMLRYGKTTMCKALHEKILHVLIAGRLLKDAYVVVKDNGELISPPAMKKFATIFMKSGNIDSINDVLKVIHGFGCKIDEEIFRMAISRYIMKPEKKDLLIQLLQWMSPHGYAVDSCTRNLILKNSHLFGRQLIAEILSKQHTISKAPKSDKKRWIAR
ncbi:pentatricopeptide repeat-containing protein At1g10910, chloroplastic [Cannabis sativa]|uniref:pentatricopeptide repeat-containing protein At1g10910, chloroplastic n=1 Tax=Cannabis sativa TaxID=3483 RepID=UPI0029C9C603|nr:pentatricopeptide repeat-containing protein At1g10910, chloroplastic [Cannabis sativa]XP_060964505.1 pentatricopeptide repeat-containing protein At1g10910, chloroplastic [Cannabis sativa]XP_060964506.1 pentatricopeptide repeat-containing protein At1g10910, chloroplastic [Cannabis sativa]